jgi:hypothetical protein
MIYFQTKPDVVFAAILDEALASGLAEVNLISIEQDQEAWEGIFPVSADWVSPDTAVLVIKQLMAVTQDGLVYRIPETHWVLLYECLTAYCAIHNDLVEEEPHCRTSVGSFQLSYIDCEAMIPMYFWDTDFLFTSDPLDFVHPEGCGMEKKKGGGLTENLSSNLENLEVVTDLAWNEPDPDEFFGPGSVRYPDTGDEEEERVGL